jgi:hypothetical protein
LCLLDKFSIDGELEFSISSVSFCFSYFSDDSLYLCLPNSWGYSSAQSCPAQYPGSFCL